MKPPGMVSTGVNAVALMAAICGDAFKATLAGLIERHADDDNALSPDAKAKRLAEIDSAILEAERTEQILIDQSPELAQREDANPRAVLWLE